MLVVDAVDATLTYPVISTFFHGSVPGGVITLILIAELAIDQEPSSAFLVIGILDAMVKIGSAFGLSILIYHSLPPCLVGYISFILNLLTPTL